jgi:hypothetical protein
VLHRTHTIVYGTGGGDSGSDFRPFRRSDTTCRNHSRLDRWQDLEHILRPWGQVYSSWASRGRVWCHGDDERLRSLSCESYVCVGGKAQILNITLTIEVQQQVQVEAESQRVGTDPDSNANAIFLKGAALNALSDDPEEMLGELQALAGPSSGSSGGQIYIDGSLEVNCRQSLPSARFGAIRVHSRRNTTGSGMVASR